MLLVLYLLYNPLSSLILLNFVLKKKKYESPSYRRTYFMEVIQCENTLPSQKWKTYCLLLSVYPVQASNLSRQQQAYKPTHCINGKQPPTIYRRRRQTNCFSTLWRMNQKGWSWQKRYYHKNGSAPFCACGAKWGLPPLSLFL